MRDADIEFYCKVEEALDAFNRWLTPQASAPLAPSRFWMKNGAVLQLCGAPPRWVLSRRVLWRDGKPTEEELPLPSEAKP